MCELPCIYHTMSCCLFWITHRGIVFSGLSPPKALSGPEEGKNGVQTLVESQLMSRERKGNGVTHVSHPPQTQLAGKSLEPQEIILRFLSWGQEAQGERGGERWDADGIDSEPKVLTVTES